MNTPIVIENSPNGERSYDIYSRLLKDRTIIVGEEITHSLANTVIAQLLFLESQDPSKEITLYLNTPGGSVDAGLAIYDTMNLIKPDVKTVCMGMTASMGAILLIAGTKGMRYILPNSRLLIHQPSGGAQGVSADIEIQTYELVRIRNQLSQIIVNHTNLNHDEVTIYTDRDKFLSPTQALQLGFIDKIIERK